jgi:hypothetical protein
MLAEQEATDGLVHLPDQTRSTLHRSISVKRYPVRAEKDPRVPRAAGVIAGSDWKAGLSHLSGHADTLVVLTRTLCPHDWLEDDVYRSVIVGIDQEPANAQIIGAGVEDLVTKNEGAINGLQSKDIRALLVQVENTPFFRTLLRRTVAHLYDNPVVWAGCGYEGTFGCDGLNQRDGINDIDWLPEPEGV